MQNPFQALKAICTGTRPLREAVYPEVPAGWPNRAIRRAVKQGRDSRLPAEWRRMLAVTPKLREQIKAL